MNPRTETSVADDELAAFVDRVLRMKSEEDAIKADIREIYAEAKGRGYDKTRLGEVVAHVRKVEKDANGEAEKEAIRDLYLTAYYRAKNKPHAHAYARAVESTAQNASVSRHDSAETDDLGTTPEHDPETGEITEPQEAQAPAQAGPDDAPVASVPVESIAAEISTPIQPETANEKAGDVFVAVKGTNARLADAVGVEPSSAPNSETANGEDHGNGGKHVRPADNEQYHEAPVSGAFERGEGVDGGDQGQGAGASGADRSAGAEPRTVAGEDQNRRSGHVGGEAHHCLTETGKPAEASASAAPLYAAPGVVVTETCPPEGALAHPYAACWPVRDIDASEGVREPIVKIGKLILDGRGRMFAARGWDGGKGKEYPVVQYDGTDPLMDCIRWNLASRPGIHAHNLKLIAGKLAKLEPHRADEIMQAFGLEVAEAAE